MTNDEISGYLSHYGYFTGTLIVLVIALPLLWKFWPRVVSFVNSVEVVRNLPVSLGEIKTQIAESGADKSAQISALKDSVEAKFEKYDQLSADSIDERRMLRDGLGRIEKELTTNHGSSLKDAIYRIETHLGLRVLSPTTAPIPVSVAVAVATTPAPDA